MKVSGGVQFEMVRDRKTGTFTVKGVSFSIGVDYQFTENWDTGIQFVLLIIQNKELRVPKPFYQTLYDCVQGLSFDIVTV